MVQQNILVLAIKSVIVDIIGDALYFPIWWYSAGLKHIVLNRLKSLGSMSTQLAFRLLLLNLFKPMFAQSDSVGRIISFFMRIVLLLGRSIYFCIYALLQLVIILLWISIPLFIFYRIVTLYFSWYVAG